MAAISNNTESWSGHTKVEVENHIKARLDSTIAASSIKAFGFAQNVMYNPATDAYPTYVEMLNEDGSSAIWSGPTKTTSGGNYIISMKLKTYAVQKVTTSSAWFPIAIAGRQYQNLVDGRPDIVYYSQYINLQPSTGSINAKHYYKDSSKELVAANVANFEIRVVTSQSQVGSESNILYVVVSS